MAETDGTVLVDRPIDGVARKAVADCGKPTIVSVIAGLMRERRAFELLFDTADKREGMAAFAERRPPRFGGR